MPPLKTVELPFAYEEEGTMKSALVKVVLCDKCLKKLMWKREKGKERAERVEEEKEHKEMDAAAGGWRDDAGEGEEASHDRKERKHRRDRDSYEFLQKKCLQPPPHAR